MSINSKVRRLSEAANKRLPADKRLDENALSNLQAALNWLLEEKIIQGKEKALQSLNTEKQEHRP